MDFSGKIVVVTGASGALGSVIVERFLLHGASVAAIARDISTLKTEQTVARQPSTFSADLTDEQQVSAVFDAIQTELGGVDILAHTVGGFLGGKALHNTSASEWQRMMSLNLDSAFLCSKYALPQMEKKGGGKIITIAALAALQPKASRAAYITAKAGLIALTQAIAEEGKAINVQANCIAPSIILTEANKSDMPEMDFSTWIKPEHIAATILHLCAKVSESVTGNVIKML